MQCRAVLAKFEQALHVEDNFDGTEAKNTRKHRAVAPVIATLLMVAIAVVGGTIIFVFSQGFFNEAQVSGTPGIELISILGYDARDITLLKAHDGIQMTAVAGDPNNLGKTIGERVVVYVTNDSVRKILLPEIRFGGEVYQYQQVGLIPAFNAGSGGTYSIMKNNTHTIPSSVAVIQPGETVGMLLDLSDNFPIGRDIQFKLTATSGNIFMGTIETGRQLG